MCVFPRTVDQPTATFFGSFLIHLQLINGCAAEDEKKSSGRPGNAQFSFDKLHFFPFHAFAIPAAGARNVRIPYHIPCSPTSYIRIHI